MKQKTFENRGAMCMAVLFILIFVSLLRISVIVNDDFYKKAAIGQTSYKLTYKRSRGTIYDTNMLPLTNDETVIIGALTPAVGAIDEVRDYLYDETVASLAHRLSEGKPVLVRLREEINGKFVRSTTVKVSSSARKTATHLIGYKDGSGHGVSGIEAAFDSLLYSRESLEFLYPTDAEGRVLENTLPEIQNPDTTLKNGVKLTIDFRIQSAVERAAGELRSGAVVVSEVGSGKIRASLSRPDFDAENVSAYLTDPAAPLINRAFCAYNVGSVFKPCVAAAALEDASFGEKIYNCTGGSIIAGKLFSCHKAAGHGQVDMNDALAESCNTYFYNLAGEIGAEKIYSMASSLGFGTQFRFAEGLYSSSGNLPDVSVLKTEQSLANLSIGQGELMLSPVALTTLYEAIANDGVYHTPTLIEGVIKDGVYESAQQNYPTRAMSAGTARLLKNYLADVLVRGTGTSAMPRRCTAAAKTATAQTGWIIDGKAVDHSWLCGFFPLENPRYVVVIISENTSGNGTPCGPLFANVCDAIYALF